MTDEPTPLATDDEILHSIVMQLAKAIPILHHSSPDLVDGYLSGRYTINVNVDGIDLHELVGHPMSCLTDDLS